MPLRVEAQSALSLVLLIKPVAAYRFSFRAPAYITGTRGPHGLHKQQHKPCSCRSAYPSSSQESMKHKDKEEAALLSGAHKEDPPTTAQHRPAPQHRFSSMVLSPPLTPPLRYSELPFPQHTLYLLNLISLAVAHFTLTYLMLFTLTYLHVKLVNR
ncbi:hypothetical protein L7F22_040808 [Adiantum nelumboides]|nr:hypothetical protein [Adiantum nelumboides]